MDLQICYFPPLLAYDLYFITFILVSGFISLITSTQIIRFLTGRKMCVKKECYLDSDIHPYDKKLIVCNSLSLNWFGNRQRYLYFSTMC